MERRIAYLHALIEDWARDPAISALTVRIFKEAGVKVRDNRGQWAALLRWVQPEGGNFYYVNEQAERIQSPQFSLTSGMGDCDDAMILLAAMGAATRLPYKLVLSGLAASGAKVRWIEGEGPCLKGVKWSHIYLVVGWPPFAPTKWEFAEPTLDVPMGWDVVGAPKDRSGRFVLPEMQDSKLLRMSGPMGMLESRAAPAPLVKASAPAPQASAPAPKRGTYDTALGYMPQVLATITASVLAYILTQQVIAPRLAAGRKRQ